MYQYAQIPAIDTIFLANLIFIRLLEEDGMEQATVALRHLGQDGVDLTLRFLSDKSAVHIDGLVGRIEGLIHAVGAGGGAILFE